MEGTWYLGHSGIFFGEDIHFLPGSRGRSAPGGFELARIPFLAEQARPSRPHTQSTWWNFVFEKKPDCPGTSWQEVEKLRPFRPHKPYPVISTATAGPRCRCRP